MDFIRHISGILEEHLDNEQFGVSELASRAGMSRSNLLRKIKSETGKSANQFIREFRLDKAMELLKEEAYTVSEVGFRVGFSSTSYFVKCFREYFGSSPGEAMRQAPGDKPPVKPSPSGRSRKPGWIILAGVSLLIAAIVLILILKPLSGAERMEEKSIAVLPFLNESNDASNVYLINGLMESVLFDLQQIQDLRVISRTSVEKFRGVRKTAPEIGRELKANYLVRGSGQKIGEQISLNVQLIDARNDRQLWAQRYRKQSSDIFELQREISASITEKIRATITEEEKESLLKAPTENLEAYDLFLRGLDHFHSGTREGLEEAIPLFKKAVDLDPGFARAQADIALSYAFLDLYRLEKPHLELVRHYADQALLSDPKSPQALIAKGFYFSLIQEYENALPYLEKALEYHPNSALALNMLSNFYANYVHDTERYLEYALRGLGLDRAARDSAEISTLLLHVSNAFGQSGFVEEAEEYVLEALSYNPGNFHAELLRAYLRFARKGELTETRAMLEALLPDHREQLEILKELGTICYYQRDFGAAYNYFGEFLDGLDSLGLEHPPGEYAKIGVVLARTGREEESGRMFDRYLDYAQEDKGMYHHLSMSVYHAWMGDTETALEEMRQFSKEEHYPYWYILFLDRDPLLDKMYETREFQEILNTMRVQFWKYHREMRVSLSKKGLI